jgi:integrase
VVGVEELARQTTSLADLVATVPGPLPHHCGTDHRLFPVAKGPNRGQPLTAAGLRTIFRRHRGLTGIVGGHPHALRHTFGTALAEAGSTSR